LTFIKSIYRKESGGFDRRIAFPKLTCILIHFLSWGVEQVELFCVGNLINCVLEADEEFLCMDFHFTLRDGGMRATFQLLHMVLEV
jgi:hypothetical protein